MRKFKFIAKDKLTKLPKNPGVYAFKEGENFLYIGKASNIQDRVKNHFQQPTYRDNLFIKQIQKIGYLKADSEIEALILEANLIKKYQPKYNIVWRDDKNYFFVAVSKEDFPRIFWTHQIKIRNQKSEIRNIFIGPFVEGVALKQTLKILRKVFPYRSCKTLPKRPCLWYQLGRCPAPCLTKSKLAEQIPLTYLKMKTECQENTKNLIKILRGKKKLVLRNLKNEMKKASSVQDFERAAKIRDQIEALERILAHTKVLSLPEEFNLRVRSWPLFYVWKGIENKLREILKVQTKISRIEAYDISNIQGQLATGSMVTFINGKPNKNFYRRFKIKYANIARPTKNSLNANANKRIDKPNDIAMLKECLIRRFKHSEWPYPDLILIDGGKSQLNAALSVIKDQQLSISVASLAKKKNDIYLENRKSPILLKSLPREIFNLILQLRDEAHRFAISYHRKLRKEELIGRKQSKI